MRRAVMATKTKAAPSATVTAVMSEPHITSGASVVMVPSCALAHARGPRAAGLGGRARSTGAPALRGAHPRDPQLPQAFR